MAHGTSLTYNLQSQMKFYWYKTMHTRFYLSVWLLSLCNKRLSTQSIESEVYKNKQTNKKPVSSLKKFQDLCSAGMEFWYQTRSLPRIQSSYSVWYTDVCTPAFLINKMVPIITSSTQHVIVLYNSLCKTVTKLMIWDNFL